MHRLFAIQGAAGALRQRNGRSKTPYADLLTADPETIFRTIMSEMGAGWGHITVLHFLTDLGLACKPDIHLVRTVRHLRIAPDIPNRKVPNLADAITINLRVRQLVEKLYDGFNPKKLRYLDKILMEISRQNLIES